LTNHTSTIIFKEKKRGKVKKERMKETHQILIKGRERKKGNINNHMAKP